MSDGTRLITLVYNGFPDRNDSTPDASSGSPDSDLILRDCDFVTSPEKVQEFVDVFAEDSAATEHAAAGKFFQFFLI